MSLHDDLLQQALQLAHREPRNPKQASLRRAVSAAYYALFHLLISDCVANWNRQELRLKLSRAFDHAPMKSASNRLLDSNRFPFAGEDATVVAKLRFVANAFIQLQEKRHVADYDNTVSWTRIQALEQVKSAERAFLEWKFIRHERIAQAYLVSFLIRH